MAICALVADDHPMCRTMAGMALTTLRPDAQVREAATLSETLAITDPLDLVILDLNLPDSRGLTTLVDVARARPGVPVLVISATEGDDWESAIAASGASGYVPKSAAIPDIIEALGKVLAGGRAFSDRCVVDGPSQRTEQAERLASLTPAERRVLLAMLDGGLNKQIAFELGLSEMTVKQHVRAILRKLAVVNRTQAVLLYREAAQ